MSAYGSSFLSLSFPAMRFITGGSGACSSSTGKDERVEGGLLYLYNSLLIFEFLRLFVMFVGVWNGLRAAFCMGLNILTSKKVLENLFSQRPLALMSRRASSSVDVVLLVKDSPCNG